MPEALAVAEEMARPTLLEGLSSNASFCRRANLCACWLGKLL